MDPKENLKNLGLELPTISTPGGNYVSVNIRDNIAYIAIQFPILNEKFLYQGRLGNEISTEQGYKAMELCALNVLAQAESKIGFHKIMFYIIIVAVRIHGGPSDVEFTTDNV